MGDISTGPEVIDDFIMIKSDGYPTYNFAHIVDDADMEISHVIRGQEFLASVPNYLNLYEALDINPPIMATMPHILGPDGNKKLSKRDGAKDVLDYIRDGYLVEALVNFIASLGWNDGTEQEIFSVDELVEKFKLDDVQRSGARFDEQRLLWMNGHYIRQLSVDKLYELVEAKSPKPKAKSFWSEEAKDAEPEYKKQVLSVVQERLKYLSELPELTSFFFSEPTDLQVTSLYKEPVDKQLIKNAPDYGTFLDAVIESLQASDFTQEDVNNRLNALLEKLKTKPAILFPVIRIAVSGSKNSPAIFGTLATLGKEKSLARLQKARELTTI
jgi:glutamyl-tRNA synthetase